MSIEREITEMRNEMRVLFNNLNKRIEAVSEKVIPDRKITKDEAGKIIGCSYQTLMKHIENEELKLYPFGGTVRLSYKEVIEFVNRKEAVTG